MYDNTTLRQDLFIHYKNRTGSTNIKDDIKHKTSHTSEVKEVNGDIRFQTGSRNLGLALLRMRMKFLQ